MWYPAVTMSGVARIGVSFEPELLDRFDSFIENKGYTNRSEAIRDLIRSELVTTAMEGDDSASVVGTFTILYNHDHSDLSHRLTAIQHDHHELVSSTTHVHVDHDQCLEVLVLRGPAGRVRGMCDSIKALRGVKHGELVLTQTNL